MEFNNRSKTFLALKEQLQAIPQDILDKAGIYNPWFTSESIRKSLNGLITYLDESKFSEWLERYQHLQPPQKTIGVIMAGNIPLVGIHDFICVLMWGHKIQIKLSSQDNILLPYIAELLAQTEPEIKKDIEFVERLGNFDAVIATGSNNTSRYFDFYFSKYPNIIRKNRTSAAILNGEEQEEELMALGHDLFDYFGLGCRNVSKIFIPESYDIKTLLSTLQSTYGHLTDHHKYANNYYYNRSVMLVNQVPHADSGFALFQENERLFSPVSVIYYEKYADKDQLSRTLNAYKDNLQCIVSSGGWFTDSFSFGEAQSPDIWDYADHVDTMAFLGGLK